MLGLIHGDEAAHTIVLAADRTLAFGTASVETDVMRLPSLATLDIATATGNVLDALGSRALEVGRVIVQPGKPGAAEPYRFAAVLVARAVGAQLGFVTPLGARHINSVGKLRAGPGALRIADGLRALAELEPYSRAGGIEQPLCAFEVVSLGDTLMSAESRKQNIAWLGDQCARLALSRTGRHDDPALTFLELMK